ncbi:hypothetical protein SEA_JKSYNGBOY_55 [Gordonia phage JKSyngboy]|uniref:Uncharacterized protein n=1 Tax=Gordonia phage JKSyngboy TaxID=2762400 RepID=A0A7G8LLA7_9CAUD|nr:hypothetical protein J1762_gp55 [Gordonia phage JKSyngboy]QNJ58029.1 hypothetical protein SEA_JKSYNGBOY_55 [Gordonia phage JKSyngboy]
MTDQTNPRTPRDIAQLLTATIRESARGSDLAAVGSAATAAAILDLADAIRESNQPTITNVTADDCPAPDCLLVAGHDGDHDTTDLPSAPRAGWHTPTAHRYDLIHASEGGDPGALADVPDGSHEHGRAPAPPVMLPPVDGPGILAEVCGVAGPNGACRREPGHGGLHHDEYGGAYATGPDVVDPDGPQAGQWLVVRTGPNPAAFGAFRTADDAHTWATEHPDTVGTSLPTILPIIGPAS